MQDRFKFRAWDNKEHYYIPDEETNFCHGMMEYWLDKEDCPLTFEQCTGLRDKNGKLIYEGDVINATPPDEWSVFDKYNHNGVLGKKRVVMRHGGFLLNDDNNEDNYWLYWAITNTCVKIIGNIHENPELLEGDK